MRVLRGYAIVLIGSIAVTCPWHALVSYVIYDGNYNQKHSGSKNCPNVLAFSTICLMTLAINYVIF